MPAPKEEGSFSLFKPSTWFGGDKQTKSAEYNKAKAEVKSKPKPVVESRKRELKMAMMCESMDMCDDMCEEAPA